MRSPVGEQQSGGGAEQRQHAALGEELREDAAASGAERDAHGDLALPRFGAGEHEAGDVGAGDEQHEADGAEQHEQRLPQVAEEFPIERRDLHGAAFIGSGVSRLQSKRNAIELGLRLRGGDSGPQAGEHREGSRSAFGEIRGGAAHHGGIQSSA